MTPLPAVSPLARTWLNAGLAFLLVEDESRVPALSRRAAVPAPSPARPPAPPHGQAHSQSHGQAMPPARPGTGTDAGPASGLASALAGGPASEPPPARAPDSARRARASAPEPAPGQPQKPASDQAHGQAHGQTVGLAPDGLRVVQPRSWPAAWKALRDRRPLPPRPLVVWTYAGLGDDLMGQAERRRQEVIVRLLKALRHPAGTHVFWPFALPGADGRARTQLASAPYQAASGMPPDVADASDASRLSAHDPDHASDHDPARPGASLFWSGEALLRPRVLLVFGGESAAALGLDPGLALYTQHSVAGRRVIIMPSALDLADDEALYSRAFPFLDRLLNFFLPFSEAGDIADSS